MASFRQPSILPGFGLTLGFTTFFLSVVVLLPLAALIFKGSAMTWDKFISTLLDPRAIASSHGFSGRESLDRFQRLRDVVRG